MKGGRRKEDGDRRTEIGRNDFRGQGGGLRRKEDIILGIGRRDDKKKSCAKKEEDGRRLRKTSSSSPLAKTPNGNHKTRLHP